MENNIRIQPEEGVKELIIREGTALPVHEDNVIVLRGTIKAPAEYDAKRNADYEANIVNVVADYKARTITMTVDEENPFNTTIIGKLEIHPDLAQFKINDSNGMYSQKALYNKMKFAGSYFRDKQQHITLLEALKKFEATVDVAFANAQDFKGSAAAKKAVEIKTNLSLDFWLNVPIFTGEEKESFFVDICVDFDNGGCIFWFESVQLHDRMIELRDKLFQDQLELLSEYVIIKQF